ncbi:MAG: hypothetical protein H0U74_07965 [Bradymonadaceae bacterium]|nr:hypothetical protein [Lujinxingiaceae bacterium]
MVLALIGLWVGACGDKKDVPQPGVDKEGGISVEYGDYSDLEPGEEPGKPLTPEALRPHLRAVGPLDAVPHMVAIEFFRAVSPQAPIDATADTRLTIEPAVEGDLQFSGPASLQFVPRNGFAPATTYLVSLASVETPNGAVTPSKPWTHSFTTPDFKLVGLSAGVFDEKARAANVRVTFSAPVRAADLGRFARWEVDGVQTSAAVYLDGGDSNVVQVRITGAKLHTESVITLHLKQGMAHSEAIVAPAAVATVELQDGPELELINAQMNEGSSGFYIDVVCSDEAVGNRTRYYWDRTAYESHQLSSRCELTKADAAERIRFSPPLKFTTTSSPMGFRILGAFERGSYTMRIEAGGRSIDGGVVKQAYEKSFSVGARKATLGFVSKGRYLPRDAWSNLAIRHMNVDQVELTLRHVPQQNLVFWLSGSESADTRTSNVVLTEKVAINGAPDKQATSWINVGAMLPAPEAGVYEVQVRESERKTPTDVARLLLTDINLIAKRHSPAAGDAWSSKVDVWAIHMRSTLPISGVKVDLVRPSGHVMASCRTDALGGCRLETPAKDADPSEPFALIATNGRDMTYLKYADVRLNTDSEPVQGESYLSETPYRAAVYSDRGVYRPGESAHLVAVVRGQDHRAPKAGLPVELRLSDPQHQELARQLSTTNGAGMVSLDAPFGDFASTGTYALKVLVASKVIATYNFNVEEFVPERLKVVLEPGRDGYHGIEQARVAIKADYLFGGSAEGSAIELGCRIQPTRFKPKTNAQFSYGWASGAPQASASIDLGTVMGELDENGATELSCPQLSDTSRFQVPGEVVMSAAVFEAASGRTTNGEARAAYHPERFYIGLEAKGDVAQVGQTLIVEGAVVDWNGALVTDVKEIEVESFQLNWHYGWYYNEESGEENHQRNRELASEGVHTVAVKDGRFSIELTPSSNASAFLVRARAQNALSEVQIAMEYSYYYGDDDDDSDSNSDRGGASRTPRPLRPVALTIKGPEEVQQGQAARISFESPFRGRALVTAETHEVLASEWRTVDAGTNFWTFKVDGFVPNVYVSVFVVKDPHLASKEAFLPERAYGVKSFRMQPTDFERELRIKAPAEVRSNSSLSVELDMGPLDEPTYATVAIVDEGVLSLTRFVSPDPNRKLFAQRALSVETFETVGWALQLQPGGTSSSTGGGDEGDAGAARIMPIKPVAMWSGIVEVAASGKVKLDFDIPQYRGALRVMAVATGRQRIGRAQAEVIVRDPLTIQTTLPRFLTANDEAQIPVFVTNLSGVARDIVVSLSAEELSVPGLFALEQSSELIRIKGSPNRTIKLDAGQSAPVVFAVRAIREIGAAKFVIRAKSGELESIDEQVVPFMPSGPRERISQRVELDVGTTNLSSYLGGWLPTSERSTIWVTTLPYAGAFDHLKHLVAYPYGCLEQTTSSTRPLLYVSTILDQVDPTLAPNEGELEKMVMHGVDRVLAMSVPGGGFAYWPGQTYVHYWGTAYATHMLLDARDAGFPVPAARLEEVLKFIERELNASARGRESDEPYLQYVLARAGRGRKARIAQLIRELPGELKEESAEQAYLLKAALYLSGDRRHEADLKRLDTTAVSTLRSTGHAFYSDHRRRAFMLSIFHDLFKNDPAGEPLANLVATQLGRHDSRHYSTQELVWSVTALGKWVQGAAASFGNTELLANARSIKAQTSSKGRSDRSWALSRASEYARLEIKVDSKSEGKLYAYISSEGVRKDGHVQTGGQGLNIKREYLDAEGNSVDLSAMNLGALVYARVTLTSTTSEPVYNVALVDRFPAGWEIENPRLGRGRLPEWAEEGDRWSAEHMNVRDDRLEVFGTINPKESVELVYALRVVTAGQFAVPPVEAEAMYDPRIWAREAGTRVAITGPWSQDVD